MAAGRTSTVVTTIPWQTVALIARRQIDTCAAIQTWTTQAFIDICAAVGASPAGSAAAHKSSSLTATSAIILTWVESAIVACRHNELIAASNDHFGGSVRHR